MNIQDYTLEDGTPWRFFVPEGQHEEWAVLWLQGFTSTIEGHSAGCQRLSEDLGVPFAILNYAGHGNHPTPLEQATREQQLREVVAVYDELVARGYKKIIVIGGSFGGYIGALLCETRTPHALVLKAPANYPDEEFAEPYQNTCRYADNKDQEAWRQNLQEDFTNRATEAVRQYPGRVFVIEHGGDEVLQPNFSKSYFRAATHGSYIYIPDMAHIHKTMPDGEMYRTISENWLTTIVRNCIQLAQGES